MSNGLRRDDVDKFFDYSIHIPSRTLYMGPEVDEEMAERFLKGMHLLEGISKDVGITILMDNVGGDEYHGLAIYDAIATSKCHITVIGYGNVMSMGSWIIQAADERVLAPNATVMIHYGSWVAEGTKGEVLAGAREMERLNRIMEETYLAKMRVADPQFTLTKLKKMLDTDSFMPAVEAVRLGLADRVLEKQL
jgi:ATP-dependent Clp endopeptidase proteolytic subunit ClpP